MDLYKYGQAGYNAYRGNISDLGDAGTDIKVALMTDTYTPDQNADDNWGEISANEIADGNGYTAGGQSLDNVTYNQVDGIAALNADDVSWANSTITARWGVIYDNTPASDADKKLLAYIDFEENRSTTDAVFELKWHEDAIFETVAVQAT